MGSDSRLQSEVRNGLLRWLHQIDFDPQSKTYGTADREYWAWKTKDFANGTAQGGLLGFCLAHELVEMSLDQKKHLVRAVVHGALKGQRSNGSFEEAFPLESSFAVTGLVLFNLLAGYFLAPTLFDEMAVQDLKVLAAKGSRFLKKTPETHGVISNHLITSYLALALFEKMSGVAEKGLWTGKVYQLLKKEGWFPEYGSADPGYQTLANHYIATFLVVEKSERLAECLEKSVQFCSQFMWSDGSFSGTFGSRGTKILYPSGLAFLKANWSLPLTWLETKALSRISMVTPNTVDQNNFVPVWCSWSFLWFLKEKRQLVDTELKGEPTASLLRISDNLVLFSNEYLKFVGSSKNGCWGIELKSGLKKVLHGSGFWVKNLTTQGPVREISEDSQRIVIKLNVYKRNQMLNTPLKAILLRVLSGLGFVFPPFAYLYKKVLAKAVMGQASSQGDGPVCEIDKKTGDLSILGKGDWIENKSHFHQHMASANTYENF